MSDSLQPHGLQHARPPCPLPTPRVDSNSCPLSWWCHPTISSSVAPFFSCPQSILTSGSLPMSWLFSSGGQSIGASASVLPMNIQDWFPLGWTGLISLESKGLSRVFSSTTIWRHQFFGTHSNKMFFKNCLYDLSVVEYQKKSLVWIKSKVKCVTWNTRRPEMAEQQQALILHAVLNLEHPSRWNCL